MLPSNKRRYPAQYGKFKLVQPSVTTKRIFEILGNIPKSVIKDKQRHFGTKRVACSFSEEPGI